MPDNHKFMFLNMIYNRSLGPPRPRRIGVYGHQLAPVDVINGY